MVIDESATKILPGHYVSCSLDTEHVEVCNKYAAPYSCDGCDTEVSELPCSAEDCPE